MTLYARQKVLANVRASTSQAPWSGPTPDAGILRSMLLMPLLSSRQNVEDEIRFSCNL
ncbi:hypothetical protein PISMIDRAFT_566804 [Pisolithus microcarpus 441]|uniref:Uncharacterized protein n=1 Tax=Pisolithus microcarpus 441 TaxID=765257 RepID=A0A0C9Y8Z3_9AGAM|nr:hypothetical protein PISMIDRAFT_566804 [Pisolithus microcarpus 441]